MSLLSNQATHDSDFWVIAAFVVVFVLVAINAIKCGFDALLRTEGKNPVAGLRLGVTTYVFVAIIVFFISVNASKDNEIAAMGFNMVFPYTTPLIWATCYAIAAFYANADAKAEHNKTGISSKNYEPIIGIEANALIKRGNLFLEDGDFEQADRYFEQALKQAPESSLAYLGKLMTELKLHNIHELINIPCSLKEQKLFQRALSFATDEEKVQLEQYLEAQNNSKEAKKQSDLEQTYIKALEMKEQINSSAYAQALINLLKTIAPYKDSEVLILEIEQKKKELDKKARKQWIITTVVIAVLIAGGILLDVINEKAKQSQTSTASTQPKSSNSNDILEVSIEQLFREYKENTFAANLRYKDQKVRVSGTIIAINEVLDEICIALRDNNKKDLYCYFDKSETDSIIQLKNGQNVIYRRNKQ